VAGLGVDQVHGISGQLIRDLPCTCFSTKARCLLARVLCVTASQRCRSFDILQGAALLQAAEEAGDAGTGDDSDSDLGSDLAAAGDDDDAVSSEAGSEEAASLRGDDDEDAGESAQDGSAEVSDEEAGSGLDEEGPPGDEAGGSEAADVLSDDADAVGRPSGDEHTAAASDSDPDGGSPQEAADAAQQAALSRKRLQSRHPGAQAAALDGDEADDDEDRPVKRRKAGPVSSERCEMQCCALQHAFTAILACMLPAIIPAACGSEPSLRSQFRTGSLLTLPLMGISVLRLEMLMHAQCLGAEETAHGRSSPEGSCGGGCSRWRGGGGR